MPCTGDANRPRETATPELSLYLHVPHPAVMTTYGTESKKSVRTLADFRSKQAKKVLRLVSRNIQHYDEALYCVVMHA